MKKSRAFSRKLFTILMVFVMLVTLTTSLTPVMAQQASSDIKTAIDGLLTGYVPSVTQTTTTSGDVTFTHPGIFMSKAMLDNMRDHVRALDEPWASAFVKFSKYGKSSKSPVIRVDTNNDAYMNIPGGDLGKVIIGNMESDSDTSFAQMIMWYITGNETYRQNAIRIIRDWTKCQSIGSVFDEQIRVSLAIHKFSFTADLLRYSDTPTPAYKWTSSDTTNYINFLDLMKSKYDRYWHFMNQHTMTVMATMASAIFRNDPDDYKNAIKRITTNPELGSSYDYTDPANPHNRGGSIQDEIRAVTKNVKTGETVPENIQVMEMGRDQPHSYVDIGGLSTVAMTAYIQGTKVDPSLGEYSTASNSVHIFNFRNDRILYGANYLCKYNLWNNVTYIPSYANQSFTGQIYESPTTGDRGRAIDSTIGIVYSYYKYIEQRSDMDTNENTKYLAQAFTKIYPEGINRDFFGDSVLLMTLEVPAVPAGVTAKAISGSQISLGWTAAMNATDYNIKRAAASGGPYTTIATGVKGTSYTDTGLTSGTAYYYVVSAVNHDHESSNSAETSATLPIVQLKFNETSGTTAADATGGNWNGTLVNGPLWAAGKSGNAVDLDGTNDYVSLPAGVVASSTTSTIAAWVNLDTVSTWTRIFDFGSGTSTYMFLTPKNGSGKIRFAIKKNGSSEQFIDGTSALATGGWHHVAVTLNGATGTLYVDGAQVGQNTAMTLKPSDMGSTTQNWIGHSQFSSDPYLNGRVDDFRVYNKALSASEVATLADMFTGPQNLTASANLLQTTLSWSAVADAMSYNIKRATVSGGPYTTVATGVTGTSFTDTGVTAGTTYYYVFSAVTSDFESGNSAEASSAVLAAPQNLTASANLKQVALSWSAVTNASSYSIKRAAASDVGPYTTIATGITGASFTDTGLIPNTTYYYVVSAVNTANESVNSTNASAFILYAPNLAVTANESQAALSWNSVTNATSYNVKRAASSGGPYTTIANVTGTAYTNTGLTNGTTYYYVVSAVNSTNESINSQEVRANVNLFTAYLKFDETSGTTAADAIGNDWNGTLVNGPLWVAGKSGNAVDLDGTDDYVALPAGVVATNATSTIAAWVNLDAVSNNMRIFDFGFGTSTYMFLTPKNGASGKIRFGIRNNGSVEQIIDGTSALPTGGWHHVAVTLNGATGALYVDGVQVGQNTAMTLKPSDMGSTTQNWIGRSQWSNDPYLNGKVDDFRIYSRALTSSEVTSVMNGQTLTTVVPIGVTATTADSSSVNLSWSAVSGATGYNVYVSTSSAADAIYTKVNTDAITGTTFTSNGLKVNTKYYYKITAINGVGESGVSAIASAATPNSMPDSNLIAWYKLDQTSETAAADSSGYGNNGTINGGVTWTAGKYGNAADLNGTNSFISLPAGDGILSHALSAADSITVATWVNWRGGGNWQRIFDFGNNTNQYMFLSPKSGSGTLRFAIKNGGGEQSVQTAALPVNQWVHVAVTLGDNTAKLYVNGELKAVNTNVTIKPSDFKPGVNYIGKGQFSDPLLNGKIDEFRIYNNALSAEEIQAVYNYTLNAIPVFTPISDKTVEAGTSVTFAVYAADKDGDALTYSANNLPLGASFDSQTGQFAWTPKVLGDYGVTFNVYDARGAAASMPVDIKVVDTTPPTTADDAPIHWVNHDAAVNLTAADSVSGVAATYYTIDGGVQETGTTVNIVGEGTHSLVYWSVDNAGNVEQPHTVAVNIDMTAPVTAASVNPEAPDGSNGWYAHAVTVSFSASDNLSGAAKTEYSLDSGSTWLAYTAPVTLSQDGKYTVSYRSTDNTGNMKAAKTISFNLDQTAPTTADDAPIHWVNHDVTVNLKAADSVSGVAVTYYKIDGGVQETGTTVNIVGEGTHSLVYWSVDNAGNVEQPHTVVVNIDMAAPVTAASVNPEAPDGSNGWYAHAVTVSFSASDNLSGAAKTEYSLDSGSTWLAYTAPVTLSQDGKYTVSYRSTDNTGNMEAVKTISFNLDQTAPTITVSGLVYGNYSNSMDITPILTLSDNLSGVDSSKTTVTISTYGEQQTVQQGATIPLYTLPLGAHTFIVTASDLAGNTGSQTITFQTTASIESLQALITRFKTAGWIDNAGIANSLQSKLAANDLADFVSEVQAQSGKHISAQAAGYLLRDARYLLSQK